MYLTGKTMSHVRRFLTVLASVFLLQTASGAEQSPLLAKLGPDSPWIVNNVISGHVVGANRHAHFTGQSFALARDVGQGQTEYRAFDGGIVAMETVIKRLGERGLYFRQATDGKKLIKLVYDGSRGLVDCDVQRNPLDVDVFLAEFLAVEPTDVGHLRHIGNPIDVSAILRDASWLGSNVTHDAVGDVMREPYDVLLDMDQLRDECTVLHRLTRHLLREAGLSVPRNGEATPVEEDPSARQYAVPRRVKRTKRTPAAAASQSKSRSKRGLLLPDTKWCGAGSENENFDDVGQNRATDRCCREHDHCPYYIEAMSRKYNLFNHRLYTISHCYCDEVFRTCLKDANTDQSAMVGRVYFNLLGMKCFEFETEEVCAERSWWGWCQRTEEQVVAKVRGSLSWP